jgi:hypothetical protein
MGIDVRNPTRSNAVLKIFARRWRSPNALAPQPRAQKLRCASSRTIVFETADVGAEQFSVVEGHPVLHDGWQRRPYRVRKCRWSCVICLFMSRGFEHMVVPMDIGSLCQLSGQLSGHCSYLHGGRAKSRSITPKKIPAEAGDSLGGAESGKASRSAGSSDSP